MTVKEASARLNVSLPTVYDLIKNGMIPARRLGVRGRKIWLDPEDVEAYWDRAKVDPVRPWGSHLEHLKVRPGGQPARPLAASGLPGAGRRIRAAWSRPDGP